MVSPDARGCTPSRRRELEEDAGRDGDPRGRAPLFAVLAATAAAADGSDDDDVGDGSPARFRCARATSSSVTGSRTRKLRKCASPCSDSHSVRPCSCISHARGSRQATARGRRVSATKTLRLGRRASRVAGGSTGGDGNDAPDDPASAAPPAVMLPSADDLASAQNSVFTVTIATGDKVGGFSDFLAPRRRRALLAGVDVVDMVPLGLVAVVAAGEGVGYHPSSLVHLTTLIFT